jgi:bacteriocin biosynthesis cyclodehydratase domain-containing protein
MTDRSHGAARPRLALPFTILEGPDTVRLVAGEDHRYTLNAPGLESWLPAVLRRCDGTRPVADLAAGLSADQQEALAELIRRLYGERVLVDGTAEDAHSPKQYHLVLSGDEGMKIALASLVQPGEPGRSPLAVLCQDRLDPSTALEFNHRQLLLEHPFLWVTVGPLRRAYVSPPFFPGIGPCLACLLENLRRLSPIPELQAELLAHGAAGKDIPSMPFPADLLGIVHAIVRWKLTSLAALQPPASLYRLHVLEVDSLEVSTHRVYRDPECSACGRHW